MTVGERMRKARGMQDRKAVCDAVGISLSALSMYENGRRVPKDPIKKKIAAYYRTTVQALFFD